MLHVWYGGKLMVIIIFICKLIMINYFQIHPNPSNMCINCIKTQVDITDGITKQIPVQWCKNCARYEVHRGSDSLNPFLNLLTFTNNSIDTSSHPTDGWFAN